MLRLLEHVSRDAAQLDWSTWRHQLALGLTAEERRRRALAVELRGAVTAREHEVAAILGSVTPARWQRLACHDPGLRRYDATHRRARGTFAGTRTRDTIGRGAAPSSTKSALEQVWHAIHRDIRFGRVVDSQGRSYVSTYRSLNHFVLSDDVVLRKAAFATLTGALLAHSHGLASVLAQGVQDELAEAKARGHRDPAAAALATAGVPEPWLHALLRDAEKYAQVELRATLFAKARMLGVSRLHESDLTVSLAAGAEPDAITPEQGWRAVRRSLEPLGAEYLAVVDTARRENWVRFVAGGGPRLGYTRSCQGLPPIAVVQWHGVWQDAFGLAHELGHLVHRVLTERNQRFLDTRVPTPVAEVASVLNELLLARHLARDGDDPLIRLFGASHGLAVMQQNFYAASRYLRFKLSLYELGSRGSLMGRDEISAAYLDSFRLIYGDVVEMTAEGIGVLWARAPQHLGGLGSYQYMLGVLAAAELLGRADDGLIQFLSAGSAVAPADLFAMVGFAPDGGVTRFRRRYDEFLEHWRCAKGGLDKRKSVDSM